MRKNVGLILLAGLLVSSPVAAQESCRELDGLIEPSERVELSSQVPGVLVEVLVDRGDPVSKGQVLARLNSTVEATTIELARAKLEFGQRKELRNEELSLENLISENEKDEIATENRLAGLELREAEARLNLRTIVSPIEGIVEERLLAPGEYISEKAVLNLAAIDPLYVEVVAPVECYNRIKKGSRADILPQRPVGGSYVGVVKVVDQVIDAASGTFGVRLELANGEKKLPAGIRCQVRFAK